MPHQFLSKKTLPTWLASITMSVFQLIKVLMGALAFILVISLFTFFVGVPLMARFDIDPLGLATKGIELRKAAQALDAKADKGLYPTGLSVKGVYELSSPQSKDLTDRLGAGRIVFVRADDPKLKVILANHHDTKYGKYPGATPEPMPVKYGGMQYDSMLGRFLLGVGKEQWDRLATFISLREPDASASVTVNEPEAGCRVVYLRPTSSEKMLQGDAYFPYATPLKQLDQWALIHELAHAWDNEVLDRKRNPGAYDAALAMTEDRADLIAESIADLATALVLLRETGNSDTFNYQMLPFRTRGVDDLIHSTQYFLGRTYGQFTLGAVSGKTDLALFEMAVQAIDEELRKDPQGLRAYMKRAWRKKWFGHPLYDRGYPQVSSWLLGMQDTAHFELERSINNLIYQGAVVERCKDLHAVIHRYASNHLGDQATVELGEVVPFCADAANGMGLLMAFARQAQLSIDWDSPARREPNQEKVAAYYQRLLGGTRL